MENDFDRILLRKHVLHPFSDNPATKELLGSFKEQPVTLRDLTKRLNLAEDVVLELAALKQDTSCVELYVQNQLDRPLVWSPPKDLSTDSILEVSNMPETGESSIENTNTGKGAYRDAIKLITDTYTGSRERNIFNDFLTQCD